MCNSLNKVASFSVLMPGLVADHWSPAQQACLQKSDPATLSAWFCRQELAGFAYLRLEKDAFSNAVRSQLAATYWQQAAAATVKLDLLARLQTAFAHQGIDVVFLKGCAYYLTLYTDPATRVMNDLDLWIQPEDIGTGWHIIQELGFQHKGLWPTLADIPDNVTQLDFYPGILQDAPLNIELHWDLMDRASFQGKLPLARWWADVWTIQWQGLPVKVLAPPAALLHACVHQIIGHRAELRWRWLLDIDRLIRGQGNYRLQAGDWVQLTADAEEAGVLPAVQTALHIVSEKLQTPLPPPARKLMQRRVPQPQRKRIADIARAQRSTAGKALLNIRYTNGIRQKARMLRRLLFPHPRYMMARYDIDHKGLLPLYYGRRLWRGFTLAVRGLRSKS